MSVLLMDVTFPVTLARMSVFIKMENEEVVKKSSYKVDMTFSTASIFYFYLYKIHQMCPIILVIFQLLILGAQSLN